MVSPNAANATVPVPGADKRCRRSLPTRRSSGSQCSRVVQSSTLLQVLLIAIHTFSPSPTDAFAPISRRIIARPSGLVLPQQPQHKRPFAADKQSPRPPQPQQQFVASGTSPVNSEAVDGDDEEMPWSCVVDPYSDECLTVFDRVPNATTTVREDVALDRTDKISMSVFTLGSALAFYLLITLSGPGSWRFFLAGGLCAAASHAVPTPIDVVKTRQQVDLDLQGLSFVKATQQIVKNEGLGALSAGLGPTVVGYLLEGAMKFGVYEVLKPTVTGFMSRLAAATSVAFLGSQVIAFIVCGFVAGTAASITLCPMEALRIRMVSDPDFARYGWVDGGCKMIKREGFLGLWRGLAPQIYKQVPYTITKNVSFDFFTKLAYGFLFAKGIQMTHGVTLAVPVLSALLASILSCVSSQPGDMLLSLVNAHAGEWRSTGEIAREIAQSDLGLRGFFVGLKFRMYHVGIIVTLQLVLYDFLKRLCGGIATGVN